MIEAHEYKGTWWLPGTEDEERWGTLTVAQGAASLELLGHFGHEIISETATERVGSGRLAEQRRILGFSSDGKPITLEGDYGAPFEEHLPGIPVAIYRRGVALIGKHFAAGEKIGFDEIAIRASDLNAWTRVLALKGQYNRRKRMTKGKVAFEVPDDIEIPLPRGEKATIKFVIHSSGFGFGFPSERASLEQDATLYLRFTRRASLEQVFERVGQIRNFLSLAVGRPVAILSVIGFQDDYRRERPDRPIPIELFWQLHHNPDPPTNMRMPHEMFFSLPEASPDVSTVMKRWFFRQKRLGPLFNLFFGVRYHPDLTIDVRFLLLAQALETYDHRRRRKPERRKLAERVGDVLALTPTVSKKIVGPTATDREAFIKLLKDSRNYYTHYNPKLESRAATGAALYLVLIQIQAVIEATLLRELGFRRPAIDAILHRVGRYSEIAHFRNVVVEESAHP